MVKRARAGSILRTNRVRWAPFMGRAMSEWVINPEEVVRLIPEMGGAVVSLSVLRGDAPVGVMQREAPEVPEDSGWSFTGLGDSEEFLDDPDNATVCDLNTLANIDTGIIRHLTRPEGVVLVRDDPDGPFEVVEGPDDPPSVVFLPPVSGPTRLSAHWGLSVPGYCLRRVDEGNLVIWRPGLTLWLAIGNGEFDVAERLAELRDEIAEGTAIEANEGDGWATLTYRNEEESSWRVQAVSASQHLMIAAYFDDDDAEADAQAALGSVEWLGG